VAAQQTPHLLGPDAAEAAPLGRSFDGTVEEEIHARRRPRRRDPVLGAGEVSSSGKKRAMNTVPFEARRVKTTLNGELPDPGESCFVRFTLTVCRERRRSGVVD
jgi:hypothetical protein